MAVDWNKIFILSIGLFIHPHFNTFPTFPLKISNHKKVPSCAALAIEPAYWVGSWAKWKHWSVQSEKLEKNLKSWTNQKYQSTFTSTNCKIGSWAVASSTRTGIAMSRMCEIRSTMRCSTCHRMRSWWNSCREIVSGSKLSLEHLDTIIFITN